MIDTVHYIVQLMWVLANAVWSTGELFNLGPDIPVPLFHMYVCWVYMCIYMYGGVYMWVYAWDCGVCMHIYCVVWCKWCIAIFLFILASTYTYVHPL